MATRRRQVIGATATVGAFLALGTPAPAAHADFDDLFQPIIDALSAIDPGIAVDTDPGSALASLDSLFDGWYQNLVNDLEQWLFGGSLDASTAGSAAASGADDTDVPSSFSIPLTVNSGTEPVVDVSVGGGPASSVLVDTGSAGLVLPIWDINWSGIDWSDLSGLPKIEYGEFGDSMGYFYTELPTTVSFTDADGDTITTGTTDVDAVLFAFPVSFDSLFTGWNLSSYLGDNADGVLGIGANAIGPTPDSIPTTALPGALGDGVLIDQKAGTLTFGADPLTGGVTVDGSPNTTEPLYVSFDGGQTSTAVSAIMDSGGVNGTIPVSLTNGSAGDILAAGQQVSVYTGDPAKGGTLLYDYTVNSNMSNSPTIVSGATMNTGNWLFGQNQVYVSTDGNGYMHIVPNNTVTP